MDNEWKCENCGTCDFKIVGQCRKNPPVLCRPYKYVVGDMSQHESPADYQYPSVKEQTPACSCWREA